VTPYGVMEPALVAGSMVEMATLHNQDVVRAKGVLMMSTSPSFAGRSSVPHDGQWVGITNSRSVPSRRAAVALTRPAEPADPPLTSEAQLFDLSAGMLKDVKIERAGRWPWRARRRA
jgi:DNA ligase (NAD+)